MQQRQQELQLHGCWFVRSPACWCCCCCRYTALSTGGWAALAALLRRLLQQQLQRKALRQLGETQGAEETEMFGQSRIQEAHKADLNDFLKVRLQNGLHPRLAVSVSFCRSASVCASVCESLSFSDSVCLRLSFSLCLSVSFAPVFLRLSLCLPFYFMAVCLRVSS